MKKLTLLVVLVIISVMFTACAQGTPLAIEGLNCELMGFSLNDEVGGVTPDDETSSLLAVEISADIDTDPSAITDVFFGDTKSTASDGSGEYICKAVVLSEKNNKIQAVLLYEVPKDSYEKTFTISGSSFESFSSELS